MTTELHMLAPNRIPAERPTHGTVHINAERCAGCQECIIRCPADALDLDAANWIAHATDQRCVGCRQCVRVCPYGAIEVTGPVAVAPRWNAPSLHPEPLAGDIREIRRGFAGWQEALIEADRCLLCPDPTCV
jgi:ferredoxin